MYFDFCANALQPIKVVITRENISHSNFLSLISHLSKCITDNVHKISTTKLRRIIN
jgi:hypothetical protein